MGGLPCFVTYCLDKLFDLAYENSRSLYEAIPGRINISDVAEDLGRQESLFFHSDGASATSCPS